MSRCGVRTAALRSAGTEFDLKPFVPAVLFISLLTGCYTNAAGEAVEVRVAALEARQSEFSSTFDEERERLNALALQAETQIEELEAALTDARAFLQRTNADLGVRVDGLESQLNELRGNLEESSFQNAQLRQELELLRQDIEIQLQALAGR